AHPANVDRARARGARRQGRLPARAVRGRDRRVSPRARRPARVGRRRPAAEALGLTMEPGTADRARAAAEALRGRGLVVVANRLPVERGEDGSWRPSSGGLVSALSPILEATGGRWVGWDGGETHGHARLQRTHVPGLGFELATVPLARAEVASFYHGFSNR